jgi:FkbH-like protein
MKLIEALEILRTEPSEPTETFRGFLACGFSPLHLQTFLGAHLRLSLPDRKTEIVSGLYGDFWGNLDRVQNSDTDAGFVIVEWNDFDARLGFRSLGGWEPSILPEILGDIRAKTLLLIEKVERISHQTLLVVSLPTLPIPPLSFSAGWQANSFDLELRALMLSTSAQFGRIANVKLLSAERLDQVSPPSGRHDVRSEIASGFPYKIAHASAIAELMAHIAVPTVPKKGLITDLDDTLWSGILGEVGVEGVSWDLEHHSQLHGLYQRLLGALSKSGVLIAAASKNDARIVSDAFERKDLVLPGRAVFPVEANWGPKSLSVGTILKTWNIGADAVVFIDDSPMELAEVRSLYPEIECFLFPKEDPQALMDLLWQLRNRFGKNTLSEEDGIRRESIRMAQQTASGLEHTNGNFDHFLKQAEAELILSSSKEPLDPRALELVNKTNQFNLNGKRYTDGDWRAYVNRSDTFLLTTAYRDKYGPLGKIAILAGQKRGTAILLQAWVMSCRAFSRRIEHRCIEEIFERYAVDTIEFDFQKTAKNGPLREFLAALLGVAPEPGCRLKKEEFMAMRPKTFHHVLEASNG